jgi:6-phosphogluconolactonase (cycloisomerase 2 family)
MHAGSISVLSANCSTWSLRQRVPSAAPAFLLHAPAQQMLYVANDVSVYEGTPRGTVEAFRIDPADGTLTLAGRTPLSLAATHPRHLALSPDGKWLAVAAYGGGIYNLLPVANDGSLGAPRGIFKDVGCGPHALQKSSHPHTLLFDDSGKHLLATDFGLDRVSVFRVDNGRLTRTTQRFTGPGRGPGACVLKPTGWLYVSHDLAGAIGCYRYDPATGVVSEQLHEVAADRCLALHPSERVLYAVDGLSSPVTVWQVDARTRRFTRLLQA